MSAHIYIYILERERELYILIIYIYWPVATDKALKSNHL